MKNSFIRVLSIEGIMRRRIYADVQQTKYAAIVRDSFPNGDATVPVFVASRRYSDFRRADQYQAKLKEVVRWIFGEPTKSRPPIGTPPDYLRAEALSTEAAGEPGAQSTELTHQIEQAIRSQNPSAKGLISDFVEELESLLEALRINVVVGEPKESIHHRVWDSIPKSLGVRDSFLSVIGSLAKYGDPREFHAILHDLFEMLLRFYQVPMRTVGAAYHYHAQDHFRFLGHEMFLSSIAILLKFKHFETVGFLFGSKYYVDSPDTLMSVPADGSSMCLFLVFRQYLYSFDERAKSCGVSKDAVWPNLIQARCVSSTISFDEFLQADFIAFLQGHRQAENENIYRAVAWWPITALVLGLRSRPLPLFERASEESMFGEIKAAIGVSSREELRELIEDICRFGLPNLAEYMCFINPSLLANVQ